MDVLAPAASDGRSLIAELRNRLQQGQAELRGTYESGNDANVMLRGRCRLVDEVLRSLWNRVGMPPNLALVAVGGYGRGELYPRSDVDLLLLIPDQVNLPVESRLEQFVSLTWDIGLDVGHAVRTVDECLDEAAKDITVQTNLLEARFLVGSRKLFNEFTAQLQSQIDPLDFYTAKRLEQEERYARYNDTPYSLEPNCKDSPGGLRDLQNVLWISRAAGLGSTWADLPRHGLITRAEMVQLVRTENFLRNVRIRLHLIAGRREDRLIFDHQEALAAACGCRENEAKRASEVLMQRYFRNAKVVTQLNTILLQNLGAMLSPGPTNIAIVINERFQAVRELLDVRSEDVFEKQPAAILESFRILQQHSELTGMTARTLRSLWRARSLIDVAYRRNPAHRELFLSLFLQKRGLLHEFRRMNQWGILGRYLPAFGRIVGQMQHDLFHVYTVDQHILQVLRNLRRFPMPEFAHEYPYCSQLITGFAKPWLIYIAALFHDIAKGRGGDHSRLGKRDALEFCRQHGIEEEDTDLVVFLVEHHLTMSAVAQKQDLGDQEVIRRFAAIVQTERRLTALYLLTHADIRGTSPKVWNAWKGKLLEDLYRLTLRLLQGSAPLDAVGLEERQEDARRVMRFYGLMPGVESQFWRQLDTVYFLRHDAQEIAWHTRNIFYRPKADEPIVKARISHIGEGLEVMVYVPDQPELFERLCGFFARLGYSIADAKIHTTRHGYALDSFYLLDPGHQANYRDTIGLIEHELAERLKTVAVPDQPTAGRLSRLVRHFPITPEVQIRPDERGNHHIMTVKAADRPGLLFYVAQILARHHIDVLTAKITTLGERVEDTFLISGSELAKTSTLLRLEQELLEALAV
ncbi:MAG: [protein-PII] uridylyltransferase [Rhodocyclaceae bacterium]